MMAAVLFDLDGTLADTSRSLAMRTWPITGRSTEDTR